MGALERRVMLWSVEKDLFASHFVLLVSPPGVGKSMVVTEVQNLWKMAGLKVGPDIATKAAMEDELAKATRNIKMADGSLNIFHSLQIASSEFGNLIKEHDLETLNFYNKIWDCDRDHVARLRHGPEINIEYPQINMLAGTQPAYLGTILPEAAYSMGFTARLVMVYSADAVRPKLFSKRSQAQIDARAKEYQTILSGLKDIVKMSGHLELSDEAAEYLETWHQENSDAPDHPKLVSYSVRRTLTAQKILMAVTCAQGKMKIELPDVKAVIQIMRQAEAVMPEIFKGMLTPKTASVMDELHQFVWQLYLKRKNAPIPHHQVVAWLMNQVESHQIDSIIRTMLGAGTLREAGNAQEPGKFEVIEGKRYIPSQP